MIVLVPFLEVVGWCVCVRFRKLLLVVVRVGTSNFRYASRFELLYCTTVN